MTHLQNRVGALKRIVYGHCNVKLQFMMANYEIDEFIVVLQDLIENFNKFLLKAFL